MSKFLNNVDLTGNELRNPCFQSLAADPTYKVGLFFYHTGEKLIKYGSNGIFDSCIPGTSKGLANGVASLNGIGLVIQNPANAQELAAVGKIPVAGATGKLSADWLPLGTGNGIDSDKLDGQDGVYYLSRANHSGTQLAATISDLQTTVLSYRLDQFAIPTADVNLNNVRLVNVGTPTLPTDGVNAAYVDSKIQGLGSKFNVRVATTANITLSGTQTIDGIAVVADDTVLVKNQTTPSQNGIYTVAAGAWARSVNTDTWNELISAYCFVSQGTTNADCGFLSTIDVGGTLGTTAVTWIQFSRAGVFSAANVGLTGQATFKQQNGNIFEFRSINYGSNKISIALDTPNNAILVDVVEANLNLANLGGIVPVAKGGTGGITAAAAKTNLGFTTKYASNLGDGTATSFTITHNLGTTDCCVEVIETASPFAKVYPDVLHTSTNTLTISFGTAPTAGQYRVIVIG